MWPLALADDAEMHLHISPKDMLSPQALKLLAQENKGAKTDMLSDGFTQVQAWIVRSKLENSACMVEKLFWTETWS